MNAGLKGKPELDILRLMGLFDRPAEKGALDALRKEPAIKGLTDALQKLKDADWQYAVANLRDLRLLAAARPARTRHTRLPPAFARTLWRAIERERTLPRGAKATTACTNTTKPARKNCPTRFKRWLRSLRR